MDTPAHDYGRALSVDAEAIGRPGQRRFRLLARSVSATACVWMEKEQLGGIGDWFRDVVERLDRPLARATRSGDQGALFVLVGKKRLERRGGDPPGALREAAAWPVEPVSP